MAADLPLTESVQPLFMAIGGGATIGSVLAVAWAVRRDGRPLDRAAAYGSVGGALAGAALLVLDIAMNSG